LRISGWLGGNNRQYLDEQLCKLRGIGLADHVEHVDCPTYADKVRFFQSLDVFSVPTTYREPKGIYVLEALANGVPVVQPRHGAFPELIAATRGGLLVDPDDPAALAAGLRRLLDDAGERRQLGEAGKTAVHGQFSAATMAAQTAAVLAQYHQPMKPVVVPIEAATS
jgi:glycosyltransferase involved in cell wall biosynthesis